MPREIQSLTIQDVSQFTKSLRQFLLRGDEIPGHAALLSMVAKAAGYQNYQHFKGATSSPAQPKTKRLERALRAFDGPIMARWPKQTSVQGLCLWAFWARLPANTELSETNVNAILKAGHEFGDHALLRRSLIDHKLLRRTVDGSVYQRIEQAPCSEALALIRAVQRPS